MSGDERPQIADVFDQASLTYDNVGIEFFKPIARTLVSALAPQRGERALDVGCGRGAVLFPLAEAIGPSGRVTGIDLSTLMIEATQADVAARQLRAEVVLGDAQSPKFPPQSFDTVAASLVLFFLPDPLGALRTWHALLVDGGRVGVSTFGPNSPTWQAVDQVFDPYVLPSTVGPRTTGKAGPFSSDAGMEQLLVDAGFTEVTTRTMTLPVRFADKDQWHRWSWSTAQRRVWLAVPEAERDQVRAAAYARLEGCRDVGGRIGFDQVIRFTVALR